MEIRRWPQVAEFYSQAEGFLTSREVEHNLILGVTTNLIRQPQTLQAEPYFATVEDGGRVVAAVMMTPPFNLVLSWLDAPAVLRLIANAHLPARPRDTRRGYSGAAAPYH